jgi:hypothetical protein
MRIYARRTSRQGLCDPGHINLLKRPLHLNKKETMKNNMGKTDRTLRVVVAIILGYLALSGKVEGLMYNISLALGVIFLLTSALGFCPLYVPLGMNTCEKK